ncbi:uncharacterized protein LOC117794167 [Drosophila innubila]|uniref:uncharacterized protein LOC117794167 n=1 Tax=Drosophila innubila TaxID=198719 RepID=UPI00148E62AD|nr:uncharacterized protein LOC117794167 [Drosophila innubila]
MSHLMTESDTETVVSDAETYLLSDKETLISSGSETLISEDFDSDLPDSETSSNYLHTYNVVSDSETYVQSDGETLISPGSETINSEDLNSDLSDSETNRTFDIQSDLSNSIQTLDCSESDHELDVPLKTAMIHEERDLQLAQMASISTFPKVGQRYEIDLTVLPKTEDYVRFQLYMGSNDSTVNPAGFLRTLIVHYKMFQVERQAFKLNRLDRIIYLYTKIVYPVFMGILIFLALCILLIF